MIKFGKRVVQKALVNRRHREYEARIAEQTVPYAVWIEQCIEEDQRKAESLLSENPGAREAAELMTVTVMSYKACLEWLRGLSASASAETGKVPQQENSGAEENASDREILLLAADPSKLYAHAKKLVAAHFAGNPSCPPVLAYGDETDWFKPAWSPDLLHSFFCFGNVFALRKDAAERACKEYNLDLTDEKHAMYSLVFAVLRLLGDTPQAINRRMEFANMPFILYQSADLSSKAESNPFGAPVPSSVEEWGYEECFDEIRNSSPYAGTLPTVIPRISVVIPSKDNPAVLSVCIHSLLEKCGYPDLEILVVDNGSSEENKAQILRMQSQLKEQNSFRYLYEKMPFNFSHMCNRGVQAATGEYVMLLNDDMEIVQSDFLIKLLEKAQRPDVGAVGSKLLYPNRENIQHVGIQNIHLGPCHKLQKAFDKHSFYHRYNRSAVNTIAVTGACILMRRSLYLEVGGLDEKMQVAFNDVEFGFRLHKAGYLCVCRNDVFALHHESLSRGVDAGYEKIKRMHGERDYMYAKHPDMWGKDPYYPRRLIQDILDYDMQPANRYQATEYDREVCLGNVPTEITAQFNPAWENACLFVGVEFCGKGEAWQHDLPDRDAYYLQGWSHAITVDNSRYDKTFLLRGMDGEGKNRLFELNTPNLYRIDQERLLTFIEKPGMCGASIWFVQGAMPAGEYQLGVLWKDTCSRQRLAAFSGESIQIG